MGGYDAIAEAYADRLDHELDGKPFDRALLAAVLELAGPGVVADLGSGPGHVAHHLLDVGRATVVAVDLSVSMASLAADRHGVPAAAGSLTALPLATSSLAGAVALFCFIHLDGAGVAVAAAELHRTLRSGGVALVAVHVGDEVRHVDELMGGAVDLDFHFRPVAELRAALEGAGLEVEAVLERRSDPEVEADTQRAYVVVSRR